VRGLTFAPRKDQQMMLFMIAATWPDQIKSEAGYTDDGPDPPVIDRMARPQSRT
jgi:hypothetical protein